MQRVQSAQRDFHFDFSFFHFPQFMHFSIDQKIPFLNFRCSSIQKNFLSSECTIIQSTALIRNYYFKSFPLHFSILSDCFFEKTFNTHHILLGKPLTAAIYLWNGLNKSLKAQIFAAAFFAVRFNTFLMMWRIKKKKKRAKRVD